MSSVTDTLPGDDFQYVEGSTSFHFPDGPVVSGTAADPVSADGVTLAWELEGELPPEGQLVLTFRVEVAGAYSRPLPDTADDLEAYVTSEAYSYWPPEPTTPKIV